MYVIIIDRHKFSAPIIALLIHTNIKLETAYD